MDKKLNISCKASENSGASTLRIHRHSFHISSSKDWEVKNEELVMNLARGAGMLRKDNNP